MKTQNISDKTVSKTPNRLALHLAIAGALLTGYGGRKVYAGSCTGGPSNFVCSGAADNVADVTQSFAGNPLDISTQAGFGIETSTPGDDAFRIEGANGPGNIIFNDLNKSTITGDARGINVTGNYGSGYISVTTTGPVTGIGSDGIFVQNYYVTSGEVIINAQGSVYGGSDGIVVSNFGGGATTITTTSTITGNYGQGMQILNDYYSTTDLTINAQDLVSGNSNGIYALSQGAGAINITTNAVTGNTDAGIEVRTQNYYVTGVTITAQGAVSGQGGIISRNQGDGDHIITTSTVTGNNGTGINAFNFYTARNLEIDAQGPVSGNNNGIRANNLGDGILNITTNDVTSITGPAIDVDAFYTMNGNVNITAQGMVSGNGGIVSQNRGNGNHTITTSTVSGNSGTAINAYNFYSAGTINIHAQGALSGRKGIEVTNLSYDDVTIVTDSTITTTGDDGIEVSKVSSGSGDISVTTMGNLSVYDVGIQVSNAGGDSNITTYGSITSTNNRGILVSQGAYSTGDVSIITNDTIQAASGGIVVSTLNINDINNISITANAAVQGGVDFGIYLLTPSGDNSTIDLATGASMTGGLSEGAGDSTTTVASGVSISGDIILNDGSDVLIINDSDFSGITLFDGGDDTAVADGFFDLLRFQGSVGQLQGANVTNWENITLDQEAVISFDGTDTLTTGQLLLINESVLSLQDNATDDDLTIDGDFFGGGTILIDTVLSDSNSATDIVRITGDTFGNTTLDVDNLAGVGANTSGDGILVIEVNGNSNGTFSLSEPINVNGFEYTLVQVGNNWYLQGMANDADIGISKDLLTAGPYVVGDTVTYELVISNDGPLDATNVVVSDTFTNLSLVSVTGGTCTPASFPCTIATLPNGGSETLTVLATIDAVGTFDNSAAVTADQPDANMANNLDDTGNGGETLPQFNVGVTVTGLATGNALELLNNGSDNLLVNTNNSLTNFSMPLNDGSNFNVTIATQPTMPNQTCSFDGASSGTVSGADVTDISLTCVTDTYFIGGTVNGLFQGNYVVLQNNGGDDEIVMGNGAFAFSIPIEDEQSYNVTIDMQPDDPIQPCSVSNNTGSVMGSDVTDVVVTCMFGDDLIFRNGFEVPPPPPPPEG